MNALHWMALAINWICKFSGICFSLCLKLCEHLLHSFKIIFFLLWIRLLTFMVFIRYEAIKLWLGKNMVCQMRMISSFFFSFFGAINCISDDKYGRQFYYKHFIIVQTIYIKTKRPNAHSGFQLQNRNKYKRPNNSSVTWFLRMFKFTVDTIFVTFSVFA